MNPASLNRFIFLSNWSSLFCTWPQYSREIKTKIHKFYLFVQADDEGADEDTDGEADHTNGNDKDGEVVQGEALGGVEHVGAGGERYVPLAEKSKLMIIVLIFSIIFFPISSSLSVHHNHYIQCSPPLRCTGRGEVVEWRRVGRVLGRLAAL